MSVELKTGDKAPTFSLFNQDGKLVSPENFKGKKLVLFFYPKDNTPTCTTEVCNLRDFYAELKQVGYEVIGISPDSVKSHKKFIEKQNLPYTLLADESLEAAKAYGVWGEKQLYGRKYMGILRTTFLIDEKGIIQKIFTKVIAKDHANQILGKK